MQSITQRNIFVTYIKSSR